jgi:hypothetical protein
MNFAVGAPKWVAAISFAVYFTIGASAAVAGGHLPQELYSCVEGNQVVEQPWSNDNMDLSGPTPPSDGIWPVDGIWPGGGNVLFMSDETGPPPNGPVLPVGNILPLDCLTELAAASTILGQAMAGGAFGATRSNTNNSFSTRDQAFSFGLAPTENGTGDQVVTVSSQSPAMFGDMYLWIDVSAFRAEATGARNYDANSFQFGADFAVSPNWVVGLSMGVSDLGADFAGGTTDGDALFLQPYVGYRSGPWSADLSIIVAQIDYNTTTGSGGAAPLIGESDMLAVNLQIAREMAMANGAMLTPSLSIEVGDEDYSGTSVGSPVADTNFGWTEVSFGARYGFALGGLNQAYVGAYADYMSSDSPTSALLTTPFNIDGWSGRVEFGGSMSLNDRTTLSAGIQSGGFGSDLTSYSGNLELEIRF